MNNYNDPQKDKRISFLSIFSSLCNLMANKDARGVDLGKMAEDINDELYKKYPLETFQQTTTPENAVRPIQGKVGQDICLNCGATMKLRDKDGSKFWGCPNYRTKGCKTRAFVDVTIPH